MPRRYEFKCAADYTSILPPLSRAASCTIHRRFILIPLHIDSTLAACHNPQQSVFWKSLMRLLITTNTTMNTTAPPGSGGLPHLQVR
jgi:hypothetical protein